MNVVELLENKMNEYLKNGDVDYAMIIDELIDEVKKNME